MKSICTLKSGMKFNRLTAIKEIGRNKSNQSLWLFKCDCGKEKILERYAVISGRTKSCGCYSYENLKTGNNRRTHGMCGTRIHRIWKAMRTRCNAPIDSKNWKWYSSKNIKVCKEWDSFEAFYKWSMENGYDDTLTIDRIDSNKDYEPSNCRWVSWSEQANNKAMTRHVTYKGETHTMREWSNITGLSYAALNQRYWNGDRDDRLFRPYKSRKVVVNT